MRVQHPTTRDHSSSPRIVSYASRVFTNWARSSGYCLVMSHISSIFIGYPILCYYLSQVTGTSFQRSTKQTTCSYWTMVIKGTCNHIISMFSINQVLTIQPILCPAMRCHHHLPATRRDALKNMLISFQCMLFPRPLHWKKSKKPQKPIPHFKLSFKQFKPNSGIIRNSNLVLIASR